jgi:hypothetical protein
MTEMLGIMAEVLDLGRRDEMAVCIPSHGQLHGELGNI